MWHILPVNDCDLHEESTTCKCHPRILKLDDGNFIIIHRSFDGREYKEELLCNICEN